MWKYLAIVIVIILILIYSKQEHFETCAAKSGPSQKFFKYFIRNKDRVYEGPGVMILGDAYPLTLDSKARALGGEGYVYIRNKPHLWGIEAPNKIKLIAGDTQYKFIEFKNNNTLITTTHDGQSATFKAQ